MPESTEKTINKHIRVLPEQWERIERAAQGSALTPNQLVIELAINALDRRKWPRSEAETRVARASLFAAQVLARDLIAKGRDDELQQIREFISTIVPDAPPTRVVPHFQIHRLAPLQPLAPGTPHSVVGQFEHHPNG